MPPVSRVHGCVSCDLISDCVLLSSYLSIARCSVRNNSSALFVGSASQEPSSSSGHPSVTPFSPAAAPAPGGVASPKRPPLVLNKDNPAEAALSRKLNALTNDLQRKQDQINSLNDRKAGGMRQQYDKLVADLLKQQETLKSKHAELHKKLEESNVRFPCAVCSA